MPNFNIQFSPKRVGSTFLQNCINSHDKLAGIDECFINMARRPGIRKSGFVPYIRSDVCCPMDYIEEIIIKTHFDKKAISMKLMYNQILRHGGLFDYIRIKRVPIIHLMRRNLIKQTISFLKMAEENHKPVFIIPDHLYHMVRQAKEENEYWGGRLNSNIKLVLYYEDIIGETINDKTYLDPDVNKIICDFFKVKEQKLFATTKKKNKDDISFYLPNIEDIRKRFKGTQFEWMMEE